MTELWSDKGVNLQFPEGPAVGLKAIREGYAKFRAERPDFRVLKYTPEIKEVQIVGEWALEIGTLSATFELFPKDEPRSVSDPAVRILKRQPDGSWKFAVVGLK